MVTGGCVAMRDVARRKTPPQPSPVWGGSRDLANTVVSSGNTVYAATNRVTRRQLIDETTVPSPNWGGLGWGGFGIMQIMGIHRKGGDGNG